MKNIKLTLATTLSVLALSFTGNAFADGDREHNNFERQVNKSHVKNVKNKRYANHKRITKRVVVKNSPTRKVVVTKTKFRSHAKNGYAKNKRFQHVKRFNKQYNRYQKQANYQSSNKHKRYNQKRVSKQIAYSVRSGDTLIQISYKTGVSVQRLARLNRIKNRNLNHLVVGQVLRLI
ncbi:LysM peptidoglycan-binding domain-containing protein [uncultured Cocleimonas sp.]|uniref:LysM peptidoglycan-binding domain-containing protein n=1 Tax=uncultured Cocleimonas sp. TaxID=1051587 RepID=UPI00262F5D00|nr:LysM peptidoglycan-binding domain-containing protein [uncultured Cocleimonas sp.]